MRSDFMSPERIALEYDGNKQKIAAAAQSGIINPTVAVMAGMFIDRMRAAAAQEQATPTTVEQDVLGAPQLPAQQAQAGLGATPQAQQLAQSQERAMQVMPPSEQGLAALPVDERMIPGGEGYAGGGIVAFAGDDEDIGSLVDLDNLAKLERRRLAEMSGELAPPDEAPVAQVAPNIATTPAAAAAIQSGKKYSLDDLINASIERRNIPLSEAELAMQERYKTAGTRASEAKSRGFNEFLAEMGFRAAASKSPRALQAFAEGATGAMPRVTAASKEAREIEEAGMKGLAEMGRTERLQKLAGITAGEKAFGEQEGIASRERLANMPPDVIRSAMAIQKPGESLDDAVARYTEITNKADKYNAISSRVSGAMKAMYESAEYDTLTRALKNAKNDTDRAAINTKIDALRKKFLSAGEVGAGDIAFMRSFTAKYGTQPAAGGGAAAPADPLKIR